MPKSNKPSESAPSLMLIMRSVAKAAGMTTADIIYGDRRAGLCHARAAVYKIATVYGYSKEEIMFYLDRNRTVAYNYEANLKGYLLRHIKFNALCDDATALMNIHPHRVNQSYQRAAEEPLPVTAEQATIVPVFADWKGKLGWAFTADECRRQWHAMRDAEEWFNKISGAGINKQQP